MQNGIKVTGLKEAKEALDGLTPKLEKKIIRKGERDGLKITLSAARSEAPVRSGLTQRNIKIRGGKSKKGSISMTVGIGAKDFKGETFYASFVLYGHKVGSRKLGNARTEVPANNFLLRAFDETKEQAVETTINSWLQQIEELGK